MSFSRLAKHPRRRALAALAAGGALVLLLSGCTGGGEPTPTPSASTDPAEPIFATDEEALAAAVEAYTTYILTVDQLTQAGGAEPQRIRDVVTDTYVDELLESLSRLSASGNRTTGETTFDQLRIVERNETDGIAQVTAYVCIDVSAVRVLDSTGADVTPPDRLERRPLQTSFESSVDDPRKLLPSGSEQWAGDDFC